MTGSPSADGVRTRRPWGAGIGLIVATVLLTAGCAGQEQADPDRSATAPSASSASASASAGTSAPAESTSQESTSMEIRITAGDQQLRGALSDNATARDFVALLPLTLTLSDFANTEKIVELPRRLDTAGAPSSHRGQPGDITYYAPWGNLALFDGTGPDATGLLHLGALDPGAVATLATLDGPVTVSIGTD